MLRLAKLLIAPLIKMLFPVHITGIEHYHAAGPRVLIVANHLSLLDGALLCLFLPDRLTFAINSKMAERWYFQPFYKLVDLFPMDPLNPLSVKGLVKFLRDDNKAVIFPEGRITVTGSMMKIYEGPGVIADKSGAMILPIALDGPQYTPLSYLKGLVRQRWLPRIRITILPPRPMNIPDAVQGQARRSAAAREMTCIMREIWYHAAFRPQTIPEALLDAIERHGAGLHMLEDSQRVKLNYRQLLTRAFVLGQSIADDTQPGEVVGILLPNSNAAVVTLLALLAFGRVPAMLNFTSGKQGLLAACETARIKRIYSSQKFIEAAELQPVVDELRTLVTVVALEDLRGSISRLARLRGLLRAWTPRAALRRCAGAVSADSAACILFTSGSEGVPKGVVLSHANLLANRAQVKLLIDLTEQDLVFNALPVFHSFGLLVVFLAMLDGARTFLYPTPLHYRIIPELCYELRATVLFGTNTFLAGYAKHAHPFDFFKMRYVVAGAEKLQEDTRRLWMDKFGVRVLEGYGATEASPVVAVNSLHLSKPGMVGELLTGMQHYLAPVAGIDVGGRLVIRGPNVMLGYLFHGDQGRLTTPATDRGPGWYDTGDIVSLDDDGFVSILGRAKRFAKIGGEMVSLSMVEELASMTWREVLHAAVAMPDPKKGELILLLTEQPDADRSSIIETARRLGFAELAIPRQVLVVDKIPVLGTGKLDYREIAELAHRLVAAADAAVPVD